MKFPAFNRQSSVAGAASVRRARAAGAGAFTLIEVMIAAGILFMALFAILVVVTGSLRSARMLQHHTVDASMVAAQLSLTNRLTEGNDEGDFGDFYPDYRWASDTTEVGTNGLFQVDFTVYRRSDGQVESKMDIFLYRPESQRGNGIGTGRLR